MLLTAINAVYRIPVSRFLELIKKKEPLNSVLVEALGREPESLADPDDPFWDIMWQVVSYRLMKVQNCTTK